MNRNKKIKVDFRGSGKDGVAIIPKSRILKRKSWSKEKIISEKAKLQVSPCPYTHFVFLLIYVAAFHSRGKSLI